MAKIDLKKLQKLAPEERVKVLKELRAKLKRSRKDEAEDLEAALELLDEATEEAGVLENIEKPKVKEIKVEELFKVKESELEEIAAEKKEQEEEKGVFTGANVEQYTSTVKTEQPKTLYEQHQEGPKEMYKQEEAHTAASSMYKKDDKKEDPFKHKNEFEFSNDLKYKKDDLFK